MLLSKVITVFMELFLILIAFHQNARVVIYLTMALSFGITVSLCFNYLIRISVCVFDYPTKNALLDNLLTFYELINHSLPIVFILFYNM